MQKIFAVLVLSLLCLGPAVASDKTDVMAAIQQFTDRFNQGDLHAAAAACDDETSIIDNFPPHEWHGPGACAKWASDLTGFMDVQGISDGFVLLKKPLRVEVTDDRAYAVVPLGFRYKVKGKAVAERAQFTIALHKAAAGWRITGWAYAEQ